MRKSSSSSMNVQQFPRVFWDYVQPAVHESSSSSTFAPASVCKRSLRSIAPKMADNDNINNNESFPVLGSYDLKSFIRPESGPRRLSAASYSNSEDISICTKGDKNVQVATHPGGTRWNPTLEQIGVLEMLYKGGMRTPNANQIEQIAEKLAKFGKIEGKNVFYWFQNHKARERQKQKRERLATHNSYHPISLSHPSSTELATARITITSLLNSDIVTKEDYHVVGVSEGAQKRRCRSWNSAEKEPYEKECNDAIRIRNRQCRSDDEASACRTLQLFPLHPEGKR